MNIEWIRWAVSGFLATLAMTTLSSLAEGLHLTRMNIPWLLGSMVTEDRDNAKTVGVVLHFFNGWAFSLVYVIIFEVWGGGWWRGMLLGVFHAFVMLAVILPTLPIAHPHMAGPRSAPTAHRRLEPPGFFALHYGYQTPLAVVVSHAAFGVIIGWLY